MSAPKDPKKRKLWIERISKAVKGRKNPHTPEWNKNISKGKKGKKIKPYTEERKRKKSEAFMGENNPFYGKTHTPKVRKKQSEIMKKQWKNPEFREKRVDKNHYQYGKPRTKKQKEVASKTAKKLWENPEFRNRMTGENSPTYGRILNSKQRKALSEANKLKTSEKNNNWRGGISFEPYSPEFNKRLKKQIRERDGFICQECGYSEEKLGYSLIPHHIDYDKKNNHPSNLIALCRSCNTKANFNREDWTKHFQNKTVRRV